MATTTVPPLCQVHGSRTSMTGSTRCRCQNAAECQVHAAGAIPHATGAVRDHNKNPMPTWSTSSGIQRVPKRKRKPKTRASITKVVCIETHLEQIRLHSLQSQNSPLKPSKGAWPTEMVKIPTKKWEDVGSAQGRFSLVGQTKHQEVDCAKQGHWGRAHREDFVLFDEVSQRQSTLDHLDKDYRQDDDDDERVESIESADRTEWSLDDTPHLRLPPQPRPARLPTPDFDDEIPPTFFPPLDSVADQRHNHPGTGKCEDTMPLLIPLSVGTLSQPQCGKEKIFRSFPVQRPSWQFSPPAGSTRWFA